MTEIEHLRAIALAAWGYQETARGCGSSAAYAVLVDALLAMPDEMWQPVWDSDGTADVTIIPPFVGERRLLPPRKRVRVEGTMAPFNGEQWP